MSNVGLENRGSVCIWMNWTQGHHVSKCAFSVRTHLATKSNFSYVPSGVFQLDFSNHEKSWKTTILHLLQIIQICCNIVTPQNLCLFTSWIWTLPPPTRKAAHSGQKGLLLQVPHQHSRWSWQILGRSCRHPHLPPLWGVEMVHQNGSSWHSPNFPLIIFPNSLFSSINFKLLFCVFVDVKCLPSLQNPFKEALTVTNWWSRGRKGVDGGCSTCLLYILVIAFLPPTLVQKILQRGSALNNWWPDGKGWWSLATLCWLFSPTTTSS